MREGPLKKRIEKLENVEYKLEVNADSSDGIKVFFSL